MKWNPEDRFNDAELNALQERLQRNTTERRIVKSVYHNPMKDLMVFIYTFIAGMVFMPMLAGSLPATFVFVLLVVSLVITYRK